MDFRQPTDGNDQKRFPDGFRILQGRQEFVTYSEHSSIRIWPSDRASHYELHQHSAVEVILPHRGVAEYRMQDRHFFVESGQILIIPPGCPHELTEPKEILRYLILFEPSPLTVLRDKLSADELLREPIYLADGSDVQVQISTILSQMISCYFDKKPMWNAACYSYLLQAYALLGAHYAGADSAADGAGAGAINPEIMNSALTYINQHFREDISLEDVASFAGFSKYYFSRIFKQFFGCTFSECLLRKRLNVASDLLARTGTPILSIAKESGFGSVATFNRVFREQKHCTPTQYRAIYGGMVLPGLDRFPFQSEMPDE